MGCRIVNANDATGHPDYVIVMEACSSTVLLMHLSFEILTRTCSAFFSQRYHSIDQQAGVLIQAIYMPL